VWPDWLAWLVSRVSYPPGAGEASAAGLSCIQHVTPVCRWRHSDHKNAEPELESGNGESREIETATQPGHPFVDSCNEYWRRFRAPLGKKRRVLRRPRRNRFASDWAEFQLCATRRSNFAEPILAASVSRGSCTCLEQSSTSRQGYAITPEPP